MQLFFERKGSEFVTCDDLGTAEGGLGCLRRFDSAGVRVVVGPMLSSVATAIVQEAGRRGMLLISPTASTSQLSGRDDMFVRLIPDNLRETDELARAFLGSGIGSVAIFYDTGNEAFSRQMAERFDSIVRSSGRDVSPLRPYRSGIDLNFTPWLESLHDTTAIFIACSGQDLGILVGDISRMGRTHRIFATHWSLGEDLRNVVGDSVKSVVVGSFREQIGSHPTLDSLRADFSHRFGYAPSYGAVFAWEAAWLALEAGSSRDPLVLRRRVLSAAEAGPLGWPLGLDGNGDSRSPVLLCRLQYGRCVGNP